MQGTVQIAEHVKAWFRLERNVLDGIRSPKATVGEPGVKSSALREREKLRSSKNGAPNGFGTPLPNVSRPLETN
jgi:hypothetical protein